MVGRHNIHLEFQSTYLIDHYMDTKEALYDYIFNKNKLYLLLPPENLLHGGTAPFPWTHQLHLSLAVD